jgi:phosphatidate cytidylyltransferase
MVFILLAAIYFSGTVFAVIFLVISILGLWEFYSLIKSDSCSPQKIYGTISGALLYIAIVFIHQSEFGFRNPLFMGLVPVILPIPLFFLSFIIEIYRKHPTPLVNISTTVTGIFYIALPLALLNLLNGRDAVLFLGFPAILIGYFILTWFYDTGAYLYGKQFGKHKFFERISPKKTWEGTIAGSIIALATAAGFSMLVPDVPLADWIVLAIIVLIFGTFGDLAESLLKRSLNIKDSGSILPGHGGILDRFDTMLLSSPFVFLYFFLQNVI